MKRTELEHRAAALIGRSWLPGMVVFQGEGHDRHIVVRAEERSVPAGQRPSIISRPGVVLYGLPNLGARWWPLEADIRPDLTDPGTIGHISALMRADCEADGDLISICPQWVGREKVWVVSSDALFEPIRAPSHVQAIIETWEWLGRD